MGARLCKPNDSEAKGLVERAHHYFETSFLPGRRRLLAVDVGAHGGGDNGHEVLTRP